MITRRRVIDIEVVEPDMQSIGYRTLRLTLSCGHTKYGDNRQWLGCSTICMPCTKAKDYQSARSSDEKHSG